MKIASSPVVVRPTNRTEEDTTAPVVELRCLPEYRDFNNNTAEGRARLTELSKQPLPFNYALAIRNLEKNGMKQNVLHP